jgi:oligoendopeptidase F
MNIKTSWDFSSFYTSDNDTKIESDKIELTQATEKFASKWENRTDWLSDPKILKQILDEYEKYCSEYNTYGKPGIYIHLRTQQDSTDPKLKAIENQITELNQKLSNQIQFLGLRLAKVSPEIQQKFLNDPQLKDYKHFLEKLFSQAKYTLSEAEEKIMTLKSGPARSNWIRMTQTFISKEEAEVLTEEGTTEKKSFTEILNLSNLSQNKKVRDIATLEFNRIIDKHIDVAVEEINSILQDKKINDELRGATRPDEMRLLSEDIAPEIVDTLIQAVSENNKISQDYYKLKAKAFGQDKLAYNERNVPYGKVEKKYSFEDSVSLVHKVLNNLDPEFAQIFERMIENGQVDAFPSKGKRGGAFCAYYVPSLPTFVFLNHTDKLSDVLTIAHEFGHAINGEMMKQKENSLNYDTPMATAEVASTFMEDFVLEELLKTADPEIKKSLLMLKLNDDISTIFRQIACYRFEQELHKQFREKGYLPKEAIGEIFQTHMGNYLGDAVDQPDWSKNWWVYWSHIRSFFYVYSYAGGLLISKSMQNSVRQNPKFISNVKEFLRTGSSESPQQIFAKMGIDITQKQFWQNGIDEVNDLLSNLKSI